MNTIQDRKCVPEDQLCFPLYVASRELIKKYKPYLDTLDLTYTQYITMLLLWEKPMMTVSEVGHRLYLDSGTLTPLLKKLEAKGYLHRTRSTEDERNLNISLTEEGEALRNRAANITSLVEQQLTLDVEEAVTLHRLLNKLLDING